MNKLILFPLAVILFISCTTPKQKSEINLNGKILTNDIDEIKLSLFSSTIGIEENQYLVKVNDDSTFTLQIKSEEPLAGKIHLGGFYHEIFLIPGDNLNIVSEEDTIVYSGEGSVRNNFIYQTLEKGKYGYYTSLYRSEKNLKEIGELASEEFERINDLLNKLPKELSEEADFKFWLTNKSKYEYAEFMNNFPSYYAYRNRLDLDSLSIPSNFKAAIGFKNFVDDSKLVSLSYMYTLSNYIYSEARKVMKTDSIEYKDAVVNIMFDSLTGKSRDYAIAFNLKSQFSRNKIDTVVYERFISDIDNQQARTIVEKSYNKYLEKGKLINSPINEEFSKTILVDDKENELTFGEMLNKYRDKVVYLDIWSLSCGPCIANMPKSKKIKEHLKNRPIEFVYITVDGKSDKLWDTVYEKTLTKNNHYRFKKNFDARMLKYMEINWVPNYMLFDKDSKLVSYTAVRPDNPDCEEELLKYLN